MIIEYVHVIFLSMQDKKLFEELDSLVHKSKKGIDEFVSKNDIDENLKPIIDVYYVMNRFAKNKKYKLTKEDKIIIKNAKKKETLALCKSNYAKSFISMFNFSQCFLLYGEWIVSIFMIFLLGAIAELACITIVGIVWFIMWLLLPLSFIATPFVNLVYMSRNKRLHYAIKHKKEYLSLSTQLCYYGFGMVADWAKSIGTSDSAGTGSSNFSTDGGVANIPLSGSEYFLMDYNLSHNSDDAVVHIINKIKSNGVIIKYNNLLEKSSYKETGLTLRESSNPIGFIYYRLEMNGSTTNIYAHVKDGFIYFIKDDPYWLVKDGIPYTYFAKSKIFNG